MDDKRLPETTPPSLRAVGGSHLFKTLDEEGLERLIQGATLVSYHPGQLVVREGDPGEALYLVRQGKVRVYTIRDDEEIDLAVLGAGACFGEVALLSGQPRTATVVAMEPTTMLCFHKRQIDEILAAYPKVKALLESLLVSRARHTMQRITGPIKID